MKLARFLAISSLLVVASLSAAQVLNVGDKAPDLKVTDWVKGTPQTLGNGNVTVVEFWATWCGPCRMSIPHLTELAHKYQGKVNFVGVSISESKPEDYTTKVPSFVKEFGDKMDYNVATEGPGTFMSKNWMTAAGEMGIPTAFLVDKDGKSPGSGTQWRDSTPPSTRFWLAKWMSRPNEKPEQKPSQPRWSSRKCNKSSRQRWSRL